MNIGRLKIIGIGLFAVGVSWLFYDGAGEILSDLMGEISPWVKVGTAIVLAFIGMWKIGG